MHFTSRKFKADPRRVVCRCQISGCYKGSYVDAHGVLQSGVEVLTATKEAHERAELRSKIQSLSLSPSPSQSRPSTSAHVNIQDQLIGPLTDLGLGYPRSRDHTLSSAGRFDISAAIPRETHLNLINKQTYTTLRDNSCVLDPDVCAAALIARENDLQEYDCGMSSS